MSDKKNRKKTVENHKNTICKNIEKSEKVLTNLTEDIEKKKEMCTKIENIRGSQQNKIQHLGVYEHHADDLSSEQWNIYKDWSRKDETLNNTLDYFNDEITKQKQITDDMESSSTSAEMISSQSTPTIHYIFEPHLKPEEKIEIETIGFQNKEEDNIGEIYNFLSTFSDSFVGDFKYIINAWNGAADKKKFDVLLQLRSFIFDQLIKTLDPDNEYTKMPWFGQYRDVQDKRHITRVSFFILGHTDEMALDPMSLTDIDMASRGLAKCFHDMSKYGKEGGELSLIKSTFNSTLTYFRLALYLRGSFNNIVE